MRISTKGRHAVMAMLDLACNNRDRPMIPVSLAKIANRQDTSLSHIEQLVALLKSAGLVKSLRGPGGGYLLTKPPDEITISEIISAVDDHQPRVPIDNPMQSIAKQLTDLLWESINDRLLSSLRTVTLADLDRWSLGKTTSNDPQAVDDKSS